MGAVLLQEQENGAKKIVAYVSRSNTCTEQKYDKVEKDAPLFLVFLPPDLYPFPFSVFSLLTRAL